MTDRRFQIVLDPVIPLRERVYAHLKDLILSGKLLPEERLVETKLAAAAGVSRTPVREALHLLEREGLLAAVPRVGYRVKSLEWEEVEEISGIRVAIETLAARWALQKMTPECLQRLEENLAAAERDLAEERTGASAARDGEFHEILILASGSRRLLDLCQGLRRRMRLYRLESLQSAEAVAPALRGHRAILDRLKAGDEAGLEEAVRDHLASSKEAIRQSSFATEPGELKQGTFTQQRRTR